MIGEPRVYYGQGAQTVRFVPVNAVGVPSRVTSATYVIVDIDEPEDSADREIASGNATLASVNTTISAAAGHGTADARALTLTSPTNVEVGRTYLVSGAARRALVRVASLTGSAVQAQHTIAGSFISGDAFQSVELEATFPALEADSEEAIDEQRRYQIVWTYTLEGERFRTAQIVGLHRYSGEAWLTESDLVRLYPSIAQRIRGQFSLSDSIAVATEDVKAEFESAGAIAENYRTRSVGLTLVRFKAMEYALRWLSRDAGDVDAILADKFEQRYDRLMQTILHAKPGNAIKVAQSDDSATNPRLDAFFIKP